MSNDKPISRSSLFEELGPFLRERRLQLNRSNFGLVTDHREIGLSEAEAADLADISHTWYCWLEKGHAGSPPKSTLERLATGLKFSATERETLFMLALGRVP